MTKVLSFETKIGWITIKAIDQKLLSVKFGKQKKQNSSPFLNIVKKQILNYISGNLKKFKLNLLIQGSNLQKKIWNELQKIPYGKTKTYGQIAKKLHTSPRYVGNVCGQNSHLLIIPCHRVIRTDGSLGGFSGLGGVKLKERLLNLEKNE